MSPATSLFTLPENFRKQDFFNFYSRDGLAYAERVAVNTLQKGLVCQGRPACLTLKFDGLLVDAELAIDNPVLESDGSLEALLRRMLGLTQAIEIFEQTYRAHPHLGPLISRHSGLRIPLSATPFEALTWAVTGQQISVGAATALRRKLIQAAGVTHSSGLGCYPDAERIAALSLDSLRGVGFSQTKAQTLLTVSRMVLDDELPLESWIIDMPSADAIREQLLRVKGIGPWTVNYALLRGFGWLDGSLHGDAAVRRGLQTLLQAPEKISEDQAQQWLASFSPWRALVAAHLWAFNSQM
jgi:DNA-3-methyladenine glycosylase II